MSNNRYEPVFPRTVMGEGFNYRIPLKSPRCETLSKRMDTLYRTADLYPDDRIHLLDLHRALCKACYFVLQDKDFMARSERAPEWDRASLKAKLNGGIAMFRRVEADFDRFLQDLDLMAAA